MVSEELVSDCHLFRYTGYGKLWHSDVAPGFDRRNVIIQILGSRNLALVKTNGLGIARFPIANGFELEVTEYEEMWFYLDVEHWCLVLDPHAAARLAGWLYTGCT